MNILKFGLHMVMKQYKGFYPRRKVISTVNMVRKSVFCSSPKARREVFLMYVFTQEAISWQY